MQKIKFLLMTTILMGSGAVFAQEVDLPNFSDEITSAQVALPNVGNDATPRNSIKVAPVLSIPLPQQEKTEAYLPFSGKDKRQYVPVLAEKQVETVEKKEDLMPENVLPRLSKPVSFGTALHSDVQIKAVPELPKKQEKKSDKVELESENDISEVDVDVFEIVPVARPVVAKKVVQPAISFDVSGVELNMTPDEVIDILTEQGYELTKSSYDLPLFMSSAYEEECRRDENLKALHHIHECIRERAEADEVYAPSQMVFEKPEMREEITAYFSTALTDNQLYKVEYVNFGDNSLGSSYKDTAKKTARRNMFWKQIAEKYGTPDFKETMVWGSLESVYMRAFLTGNNFDAHIVLENVKVTPLDKSRALDLEKEREKYNPFTFMEN